MGNACDTHLEPIIKMQMKCIRTITFSCYFEQTEPLLKELEILSFKKLVIQRILLMMFKYSLGIVPKPITLLFTRNEEIHHHNTRHSSLLHPMIGRTEGTYKTLDLKQFYLELYIQRNIYKRNHNLF